MKRIRPTAIADAQLISSSVPETEHAAWSSVITYALGTRAIKAHRIWESTQAGNLNHDPETAGLSWWRDTGATNRWAMFDGVVGTQTTAAGSIVITLAPGRIDSLALLQVDASSVHVAMRVAGEIVYEHTESLIDNSMITDWYEYFFEPFRTKDYVALTNIPVFGEAETTITLTKTAGTVKCGMCIVGLLADLGETLSSPRIRINDYSIKTTDTFGNTTLVKGKNSKGMDVSLKVDDADVDRIARVIADAYGTAGVWIGSPRYSSLLIYGYALSFSCDIKYKTFSYNTLSIEGMI